MTWTLAYTHDANGNRTAGDIDTLIDAVQHGYRVRFLMFGPPFPAEYLTEAQDLHIQDGVVYATNTLSVSVAFTGNKLLFQDDSYYWMISASTLGDLDEIRWDVGAHIPRGHNQVKTAIKWFVG